MKSKFSFQTFLLLIMFVSASCGTYGRPSPTLAFSPQVTSAPGITAAPSSTSEPAPTETHVPTPTPLPTLIAEDAHTRLTNLIQGDVDCLLPCWFGVIPGQSDFNDAGNIFSQFSAIGITEFSSRWAYIKVIYPTYYMTTVVYPTADGRADHILVDTSISWDANGKVLYADSSFRKTWQKYFLPELFTRYGAPEKIFLDTTLIAADPGSSYPYVLWVVYPQEGFLIRYEGENSRIGDNIRICPLQSRITMTLWNPEMSSYEKYMQGEMAMGTSLGPQPIESVTDFNIDTFYQRFKGAGFNTCFETPASIWPH